MPSPSSNTSWNNDSPLDHNLANVILERIQAIVRLAGEVEAKIPMAETPSEQSRLYRAAMTMHEKAAKIASSALKERVSQALPRTKKVVEA
jgi:DNA primase